jgi:DNA-binding NtrC family response regulator
VTVLVVEDHRSLRRLAVTMLETLGHAAVEAQDPAEAEAIWRRRSAEIEAVLLDVHLGAGHGLGLARALEAERPGLRVLFMSGDGAAALLSPELAGPRRHFLEKPFSLASLRAAFEQLLARP